MPLISRSTGTTPLTMRSTTQGMAGAEHALEGVLPVDKPVGPTSHDMVARARRALGTRRIGHTGTLDPFASGLLLLCVGRATRIAEYLSGMDKRYCTIVRLGVSTDTGDAAGTIIAERDPAGITRAAVVRALKEQRGDIMQVPPAYSAKKVRGERAYTLARQGRPVDLHAVPVTIHELTIRQFVLPDIHLDVTCSSGTYIRAIARDLGTALGVGAHLTSLRRTVVGPHSVDRAVAEDVLDGDPAGVQAALIPTLEALGEMPRLEISEDDAAHIRHGRLIARDTATSGIVALAAHGELVAIAEADGDRIRPRKVFL
jgi:tRNA pseudouridine55 synthase